MTRPRHRPARPETSRRANALALWVGLSLGWIGWANGAAADTIVYRFEAERSDHPIPLPDSGGIAPTLPEGSVTALAAALPRLSGTFGFDTDAPRAAGAGIPETVSFGSYDTGFIVVDQLDLGSMTTFSVQLTDGVTQLGAPARSIADEVTLESKGVSSGAPLDALALRLRYADAERLQSVDLPRSLILDGIEEKRLIFSTRIDMPGDRATGQPASGELLGVARFEITAIERLR